MSQINDRHREEVFAGQTQTVPAYELSERTLDLLMQLKQANERQEKYRQLMVHDMQLKADEYQVEADRLGRLLDRFGMSTSCLSQSGTLSLQMLVDVSMALGVQHASDSDLLLAMGSLAEDSYQVKESRRSQRRLRNQLLEKTQLQLQRNAELSRAVESVEQLAKQLEPEMTKKAAQSDFLQQKSRNYRSTMKQLTKELSSAGVDSSVRHDTLVKKSENLQELKKRLQSVRTKLDSYHALPPDLLLARVKVEEAKQELADIEAEFDEHIDLIHM